ncbi:gliding motility lipoprotein GldB [Lunatimonas salinarum]|uniref:gliding motility lipoprotein GldB n=1 Tax=Lunatimonas salinarum TaxID=1774590 RepID=UPI001AE04A48|nr:gliding motility lipoprotein GldB [Lunatimonas salinarum]
MPFPRVLLILYFPIVIGCGKSSDPCTLPAEIEAIPMEIRITRLENVFFDKVSRETIQDAIDRYPDFAEQYLLEGEFEDRGAFVDEIVSLHRDPGMQELYGEVLLHYPDLRELENAFLDAFKRIKYYYPEFEPPVIYTYVSGFTNDLFLTQDMLVISLDYFLPNDHRFQPVDLPQYITRRYDKDHLVPTVITAISSWFNKTDLQDNTLLAEMIFYGKSYHFTKQVMPCTPDEFIIGYTPEDIIACYSNEEMIYAHFIENELFYETNPFEIRKYTGEAPFTDEISLDAPGRIGRWMGWNIVDDYRENNVLTLPELMNQDNAREIFRLSGYRPR